MNSSFRRFGSVFVLGLFLVMGCDDSASDSDPADTDLTDPTDPDLTDPTDPDLTDPAPPDVLTGVLADIVTAFNSCPLQQKMGAVGQPPTLDGYQSCDWSSLATSGIVLHEWDDTEYLPSPWIQKWEQMHTNLVSSSGILNNWGRAGFPANTTPPPGTGADGMLSVYVEGADHFPRIGGIIYNTVDTSDFAPHVATMRCGCVGDCGDDTKDKYGGDGCGCPDSLREPAGVCHAFVEGTDECGDEKWAKCREYCPDCLHDVEGENPCPVSFPAGVCNGFVPGQDDCATFNEGKCSSACLNCDNSCNFQPNQPISDGNTTCSVQRVDGDFPDGAIKALMLSTIQECQANYGSNQGDCYNEVLIDVSNWTKRTPIQGATQAPFYEYLAQVDYLPGVIWAFEVPKQYDTVTSIIGRVFTTRAWHNFNKLYSTRQVPLLEFDALTEINTEGPTNPFKVLCENNGDTSPACTSVLQNANIDADTGYFCRDGITGQKYGSDTIGYRINCPEDSLDDTEDDSLDFTEPCACDGCDGCCSEDSKICFTNWPEATCEQYVGHQWCRTDL